MGSVSSILDLVSNSCDVSTSQLMFWDTQDYEVSLMGGSKRSDVSKWFLPVAAGSGSFFDLQYAVFLCSFIFVPVLCTRAGCVLYLLN